MNSKNKAVVYYGRSGWASSRSSMSQLFLKKRGGGKKEQDHKQGLGKNKETTGKLLLLISFFWFVWYGAKSDPITNKSSTTRTCI